jgi:hypothetical protein
MKPADHVMVKCGGVKGYDCMLIGELLGGASDWHESL